MYKAVYVVLLILFQMHGYAENNLPLSGTDYTSSTIINNAVNVISGDYLDSELDITLLGPEPLHFQRYYSNSNFETECLYQGFGHNHDSLITRETNCNSCTYKEKSGRSSKFIIHKKSKGFKYLDFSEDKLITDHHKGIGANYIKNIQLIYKDKKITAKNGFGDESFFESKTNGYKLKLKTEQKANGNKFCYGYDADSELEQIQVLNKSDLMFSWLRIIKSTDLKANPSFEIHASDGRKIHYHLRKFKAGESKKNKYFIDQVSSKHKPTITYKYQNRDTDDADYPNISKKSLPNGRYLSIDYFKRMSGVGKTDFRINRVQRLRAPAGSDNASIQIYHFDYHAKIKNFIPLNGYTSVFDAYQHFVRYDYSKKHKLESIKKYRGNHSSNYSLYSTEKYIFDKDQNLIGRNISDQNEQILAARIFDYDEHGNITSEYFYGNLSGNSPPICFKKNSKHPIPNHVNAWIKRYRYTKDNMLLEEIEPNGKSIHYEYFSDTRLLKAKFTLEHGIIRIREFYDYDENALLTLYRMDDGTSKNPNDLTSVTMRKIRRSYNSEVVPYGLPVRVDEFYYNFETGQECLLSRIFNHYDIRGQLLARYTYDSKGVYLYSNLYQYDAHGNIVLETDAANNTIKRSYNKNNNLIYERGISKNSYKNFHYDFMGRLIQIQEYHDDGTVLTTANSYDYMGNLIATVDPFGHQTKLSYDEFNRLIKTENPGFYNENNQFIIPVTSQDYDIFGNLTTFVDAAGKITRNEYNIRGLPTKISYPDGTVESFEYNDDGTLKKSIDKNGSYSSYYHDCFNRLLKKEHFSNVGVLLYVTSTCYNSFHKLSETDAAGIVTHYKYDAIGHLIAVTKNDTLKEFEYDDRLNLVRTKEWTTEQDYHVTILVYDILDRVIEERIENQSGIIQRKTEFQYDHKGNKTFIITHNKNDSSRIQNKYDSHNKLIKTIDPLGNETCYAYNYQAYNKHGQRILEVVETDSKGIQTFTDISLFDKAERVFKKNSLGQIIADKEIFYDALYNVSATAESLMRPDQLIRIVKTKWIYNHANLISVLIEAFGDIEQRTTEFKYNFLGEKTTVIKPDGTQINHTYDDLGRLQSYLASNGSFCYHFEYDQNNNLIKSYDQVNDQSTVKIYDHQGRLSKEVLGTGVSLNYQYDRTGRPVKLTFPDMSSCSYEYDGLNLTKLNRFSKEGHFLYAHEYLKYDLSGHVIEEKLINQDSILYDYDINGSLVDIHTDTFSESISYDVVGNIISIVQKDSLNESKSDFTYDDLQQLRSENGVSTHQYVFDSLNNRISYDETAQEYNALNQLLKSLDHAYAYDKCGNRIESNFENHKTIYKYDALDRLVQVDLSDSKYLYTYDSFNRRLSKTKASTSGDVIEKINYLYIGQNEVGAIKNDTLTEIRILGVGKGAEIGAAVALELNGKTFVPIHDHNGNVIQINDTDNNILESYRYSAFGTLQIYREGNNIYNPWTFSSKRLDEETGFINFGRRYYDAITGTWITPDPLGFDEGPNLYAYVNNSPLSHFDLYGLRIGNGFDYMEFHYTCSTSPGSDSHVHFTASPLISMIGQMLHTIVSHAVPVPVVRETAMAVASVIAGQGFSFKNICNGQKSKCLASFGTHLPKHRNMSVNGILNWENCAASMAEFIKGALGGQGVDHVYKATRGLMTDLSECALLMMGYETEAVRLTREKILENLEKLGPDGTLDIYAHSMGGLITARAIEGLADHQLGQISIYTFGSAKMIYNKCLKACTNIVSPYDPIPFIADPLGCLRGMISNNSNVEFVRPTGYPILDHIFLGGTYEDEFKKIALLSKKRHGT